MIQWALIALCWLSASWAQMDLNLAASGRTYPNIGGSVSLESGYNYLWWEQDQEVMYGLIRPSLYLDSSAVINTYGGKISLYPISFAGIEIGKETTVSDYDDFAYYNCSKIACSGRMEKSFVSYKMGLALGPIVATGNVMVYESEYNYNDEGEVAEYLYAALADSKSDSIYFSRYVFGVKNVFDGFLGLVTDFAQISKTSHTYQSTYLLYGFRTQGGSNISIGAGTMESDMQEKAPIFYARWSWWPLPTKLLF